MGPWSRDRHHDGQREFHTAHHHKFQGIVQHGRIGAFLIDDREHLVHIVLKILRFHGFFPCHHLIHIAADGVDLSVVDDKTVGMRPHPAWIRVGAEPGVYHGDGRLVVLIL